MQGTSSRFVANIVPLQNVQTNLSGQGQIQAIEANIFALQQSVQSLQALVQSLQTRISTIEGKVG